MNNAILQAFRSWEDQQRKFEMIGTIRDDQQMIRRLKLAHLQQCRHRLSKTINAEDKPFLPLLNNAINRLEKQVHPNLVSRLFFRIKDRFFDRPVYLDQLQQRQQANIHDLRQQLTKAGLGNFAGDLQKQLAMGEPINLSCQLDQNRTFKIGVHFSKDTEENFNLARIDAKIGNSHYQFKVDEWPGLDMAQVKNLLEGRAIKQHYTDLGGRNNTRWLELAPGGEVKQYLKAYGFEPEKLLDNLPFDNKESLMRQMERGNEVPLPNGFIQADPATATLKLFDKEHKEVTAQHFQKPERKQVVIKQLSHPIERKKQAKIKI